MQSDAAGAVTSSPPTPAISHSARAATVAHKRLYRLPCSFYTALVIERRPSRKRPALLLYTAAACFLFTAGWRAASAQEAQQKPAVEPAAKPTEKADKPEKPAHPAQIELLETKVRVEANGDSRKEVHALVKINNEIGVRQFAQLNFDFNRSFESVEIPMVHITHANGGTSDILPSAVTDHPNPAVVNAPAYQDVRVKSVRILGLEPGDTLEYRVVRSVAHDPRAPGGLSFEHTFDHVGVVTREDFELNMPAEILEDRPHGPGPSFPPDPSWALPPNLAVLGLPYPHPGQIYISPQTPETSRERISENSSLRIVYRWLRTRTDPPKSDAEPSSQEQPPDVVLTTWGWPSLSETIKAKLYPLGRPGGPAMAAKYAEIVSGKSNGDLEALYQLISEKIRTVDLPLGSTRFQTRDPLEILSSGYATAEDKVALFLALLPNPWPRCDFLLTSRVDLPGVELPRSSLFSQILFHVELPGRDLYLDPATEVAPFGVIRADLRGRNALVLDYPGFGSQPGVQHGLWKRIPSDLPFTSFQNVKVDAALAVDGKLSATVHYSVRGDNELILRLAFHKTPKERWMEVAQLLSITDGFRGQVSSVRASDPYATKEPFTVEYDLDQPKFVDWLKKTVRIPALLPQLGLPDPPAKPASGSATAPIDLGTPLEVETKMTLHLSPGTSASAPAGTSVARDYAAYSSQYSVNGSTLTATRHIKFILREVPAARAADYNAFLRAVQNDESQDFTLEQPNPAPKTNKP